MFKCYGVDGKKGHVNVRMSIVQAEVLFNYVEFRVNFCLVIRSEGQTHIMGA